MDFDLNSVMEAENKRHKLNPYTLQIGNKLVEKYKFLRNMGDKTIVVQGERKNVVVHARGKYLEDEESNIKLYPSGIEKLTKLDNSEIRLLMYILNRLHHNEDKFYLFRSIVMADISMKSSTLSLAIKTLLNAELIAEGEKKGEYFINPNDICKGNRVSIYKAFIETQKG